MLLWGLHRESAPDSAFMCELCCQVWAGMPILLPTASKQLNTGDETLFIAYDGINRSWSAHRPAVRRSAYFRAAGAHSQVLDSQTAVET